MNALAQKINALYDVSVPPPQSGKLIYMNLKLTSEKFKQLRRRPNANLSAIEKIETWLIYSEPFQRLRMNPYEIARWGELELDDILPEFLSGVNIGLFKLYWNVHCPYCNMVTREFDDLRMATASAYCEMCEKESEVDFLHHVEGVFSLSRDIEDLDLPPISCPPPSIQKYFGLTAPYESTVSGEEVMPPGRYRYVCPLTHSKGVLTVEGNAAESGQILKLRQLEGRHFDPEEIKVRPGPLCFELTNTGHPISSLQVYQDELSEPLDFEQLPKRLTGFDLIHFPDYHRFFANQALSGREWFRIHCVTIMFVDIADSTQRHGRFDDAKAYHSLCDYLAILFRNTHASGGIEIKTIGDAVMLSFRNTAAAIKAAIMANFDFQKYNQEKRTEEHIRIKVGIHKGPALLVSLNGKLDYFGRTVHEAAAIQKCSKSGELSFSEAVCQDASFKNILREFGISTIETFEVVPRTSGEKQKIFKIGLA